MSYDLISRSALIEYCKRQAAEPWNRRAAPVSWADAYVAFADDVEEDFLGVDAVEVVRCKDCKRCRGFGGVTIEPDEVGICKIDDLCVKPNDFCSYGERRSE